MPRTSWKDVYDYRDGHTVEWIRGGPDYFDEMISLIEGAKKNIHLQVYLIVPDDAGTSVLAALKKASLKGIIVNLVVDDFGADKITEIDESEFRKAGIIFKRFEPLFSSGKFYVGRRLHHKILLVDDEIALVGGINIANRYRGTPGEGFR